MEAVTSTSSMSSMRSVSSLRKARVTEFFRGKTDDNWQNILVYTCLETFAIGWIDVMYFFKYSCFVSMMTGNVIQMGKAMAIGGFDGNGAGFYIVLIFMFWGGVMSFRVLRHFTGRRAKRSFSALFLGYYILYICTSTMIAQGSGQDNRWPAIFLPPMFGVHAAVMIKEGLGKYPGIAMTSNSVNLNYFFFDVMMKGWEGIPAKQRENAMVILGNFVAMMVGAFCAAFIIHTYPQAINGEWLSVPPVLIMLYMMLCNDSLFKLEDEPGSPVSPLLKC